MWQSLLGSRGASLGSIRHVRCLDCRHPIALLRWLRLPDHLVCYRCGAAMVRSGRPAFRDGLLIWLLLMFPATLLPLIGGVAGLIAALVLAGVVVPLRPWDGVRYTLPDRERGELPPARALGVGAEADSPDDDRGPSPHPPGAEPP